MLKLVKKVKTIKNKIFFLIKVHMLDPKGEKFNIQYQINKIYISLQKYMSDVSYDEDGENEDILFKETLEYQEKIITDEKKMDD